ncbi:2-dehydropantoate 2-reductase [Enterovirga aerilata]|uniref:2-dehydropantoate 2-reductase n=1 Tax=Enterovirga aerilata TaxID=2730920 RepID=A0A849I4L0_9HYPH|nr:2-dehydropantoate 2-reductase [Enterovirga sp. DB1703]NNM71319.1 2-dehydropantoate 2-reductase [Enterovirga sp. DB1703]
MSGKVAIIGSGAIGGYLAAELAEAGRDVTLCVRTPFDRLIVEEPDRTRQVAVPLATRPEDVGPVPFVLLTTKSQDTAGTKPWLDRLVGPETIVVVVQNGVGHEERVRPLAPGARAILPAIIYCSAERVSPGRIRHHAYARLTLSATEAGAAIPPLFAGSAFEVAEDPDFTTVAWRKLLGNLVANPITALTLRRIRVLGEEGIGPLVSGVLAEALRVAQAEGAKLTPADADQVVAGLGKANPDGGTSMLYDRLAGRPLEHDYITGAVVRAAERHGIEVPLNRALLALCQAASGRGLDGSY